MERNDILKQVNDIFIEVFDNNQLVISDATTVFDIDEWDSLAHILLITSVEKQFKIRFTSSESQSWNNVGEMIDTIYKRLSV